MRLPDYRSDTYVDESIRFIRSHRGSVKDRLFFLLLSHLEPHHQNRGDYFHASEGYGVMYRSQWTPPDPRGSSAKAAQLGETREW